MGGGAGKEKDFYNALTNPKTQTPPVPGTSALAMGICWAMSGPNNRRPRAWTVEVPASVLLQTPPPTSVFQTTRPEGVGSVQRLHSTLACG